MATMAKLDTTSEISSVIYEAIKSQFSDGEFLTRLTARIRHDLDAIAGFQPNTTEPVDTTVDAAAIRQATRTAIEACTDALVTSVTELVSSVAAEDDPV